MKEKKNFLKYFMTVIITALITCLLTTILVYSFFIAQTGQRLIVKDSSGKNNVIASAINNVAEKIAGQKNVKNVYKIKIEIIITSIFIIHFGTLFKSICVLISNR